MILKTKIILNIPSFIEAKILQWHQLLFVESSDKLYSHNDDKQQVCLPFISNTDQGSNDPDEWRPQAYRTEKTLQAFGAAMPDF